MGKKCIHRRFKTSFKTGVWTAYKKNEYPLRVVAKARIFSWEQITRENFNTKIQAAATISQYNVSWRGFTLQ